MTQRLAARRGELRIAREDQLRVLAGLLEQWSVDLDARDAKARDPGLPGAEHVAFAAQAQILLGDAKTILRLPQDLDARRGGAAGRGAVEQGAVGARQPAPDAATQLVNLRKAEALGMLDHHHGG